MLYSFRGARAHDYEWLRSQYFQNGGARFPRNVNEAFTLVNDWSTDLRYLPRTLKTNEAKAFLSAASSILHGPMGDFEMAVHISRGETDPILDQIIVALEAYATDHPDAQIAAKVSRDE